MTFTPGLALSLATTLTELPEVAQAFANELAPGDWVFFYGDLGAGKTTFVQALAQCLNPDLKPGHVSSPTFSILNVVALKPPNHPEKKINTLLHMDLYRLKSGKELLYLGLEELFNPENSLVAVEWPRQVSSEEWEHFFATSQCPRPRRFWDVTLEVPHHAKSPNERLMTFCLR